MTPTEQGSAQDVTSEFHMKLKTLCPAKQIAYRVGEDLSQLYLKQGTRSTIHKQKKIV